MLSRLALEFQSSCLSRTTSVLGLQNSHHGGPTIHTINNVYGVGSGRGQQQQQAGLACSA